VVIHLPPLAGYARETRGDRADRGARTLCGLIGEKHPVRQSFANVSKVATPENREDGYPVACSRCVATLWEYPQLFNQHRVRELAELAEQGEA
jgi:hypothetical protein